MKRSNYKDFGSVPSVRYNRSKFLMPHSVKTSMSVGELVPIACTEVLPGDTFSTQLNAVIRVSSSFIKPIVDDLYADIYHFFVPYRLVFDDAEKVFGNPSPSAYTDNDLASFPVTKSAGTVSEKTVADYLGLPLGYTPQGVNIMPFRAFAKIYNDWFRNENVIDEVYIQKGNTNGEAFNNAEWSPNNYMGKCPKVSKKKDYFTSCLPRTQKGQAVALPLGTRAELNTSPYTEVNAFKSSNPLILEMANSGTAGSSFGMAFTYTGSTGITKTTVPSKDNATYSGTPSLSNSILGTNLYADLTDVTSATVNDLRFAFQLQKSLEKDALYGSTYREYLLGHFGVSSPDSRLQYSEYLGGGRFPITVQQTTQTTPSDDKNATLGNVGAWSLSNGKSYFSKAFVEHGYVFTVACIRQIHTYQQGIPKMFMRSVREDFYDPLYANLGEQPVWSTELFSTDPTQTALKQTVFGYNEAWADYRYIPNRVSGQMRHDAESSFDVWHLADYYANTPTLSKEFVEENSANIDRVLNVPTATADNFLCDFYFKTNAIRVLPAYSIPGLIDHH